MYHLDKFQKKIIQIFRCDSLKYISFILSYDPLETLSLFVLYRTLSPLLAEVPSEPRNLTVVVNDANDVELKWREPESDGGAPIDGYLIERRFNNSETWKGLNQDLKEEKRFLMQRPARKF